MTWRAMTSFRPCGVLVLALALGSGCGLYQRSSARPCRQGAAFQLVESPPWSPSLDPEYAKLRPFRSYLRVLRVGPFADHFAVSFMNVEGAQVEVAVVSRSGAPPQVTVTDGWTGTNPPLEVAAVPAALRGLADAAEAAICTAHPGSTNVVVEYRGAFRQITVQEEVPYDKPARFGIPAEMILRADRDLGKLSGPEYATSGLGGLAHGRPNNPRWVEFVAPPEFAGRCLLCAAGANRAAPPSYWPDLARGILATARSIEHGTYHPIFNQLLASQSDRLVPAEIDQTLELILTAHSGPGTHRRLTIPLRGHDAAFSAASGLAHTDFRDRRLQAEAHLTAVTPLPSDRIDPDLRLPMKLVLRVSDGVGNEVQRTLQMTAVVLLDHGVVAFQFVEWNDLNTKETVRLRSLLLPPRAGSPEIEVEFDRIVTLR